MRCRRQTPAAVLLIITALAAGCGDSDKPNASRTRERMSTDINAQMDRIAAELAAEDAATPFDPEARAALLETIDGHRTADRLPFVPLDAFFEGNRDLGSIAPNVTEHPGIEHFHTTLKAIRDRPDVQEVFVQVSDVDPDDESSWPVADSVLIYTTTTAADISTAAESLQPDGTSVLTDPLPPPGEPLPKAAQRVITLWWD